MPSLRFAEVHAALECGRSGCRCSSSERALVHCPHHGPDDETPNLNLTRGRDGQILAFCHRCGKDEQQAVWAAVLAKMGITKDDDAPPPRRPQTSAQQGKRPEGNGAGGLGPDEVVVATYTYADAAGEAIAFKRRIEDHGTGDKRFDWRPASRETFGKLAPLKPKDLPLWGAEILAQTDADTRVYLCEGEKATTAAREAGCVATCWSGSSSNPPSVTQLEFLRGFDVWLWPDNDVPGRNVMRKIRAELRRMGVRAATVRPPRALPEKGDAYDYFVDAGGTVPELAEARVLEPTAMLLETDAVQVIYPTDLCDVALTFTDLRFTRLGRGAALDSLVRVALTGPITSDEAYVGRCNLLSSSGKRELRQELGAHFKADLGGDEKALDWLELLVKAIPRAERMFMGQSRAIDHYKMGEPEPERFLVRDVLPYGLPSVLFAPGMTGKSLIASHIAVCVAYGTPWLQRETRKGAVIYLDYESTYDDWNMRIARLLEGMDVLEEADRIFYWPARGVPLPDLIEPLRADIAQYGVELLIIDSALLACRGKAEDSDVAGEYFRSLNRLGITSITLAHVTGEILRQRGIPDRPFGSVFWRELPRRNIYLKGSAREVADRTIYDYALYETKSNARQRRPFALRVAYEDPDGPIRLDTGRIEDDPELMEGLSVADQIEYLLRLWGHGTPSQIVEETGLKRDSVAATLRRLNGKKFIRLEEGGGAGQEAEWGLLETQQDLDGADLPVG